MTGVNNFSHDHLTKLFIVVCFSRATRKGIGIFGKAANQTHSSNDTSELDTKKLLHVTVRAFFA